MCQTVETLEIDIALKVAVLRSLNVWNAVFQLQI